VILPDVNVLIYAFRPDSPDHDGYRAWLEGILNGDAAYAISPQVLSAVVRICTHPKIFVTPDPLEAALNYVDILATQPHCVIATPGDRHWRIFRDVCLQSRAHGNLVQDAWFAALAIEWGCEWITTDRDYARFDGLRWRPPF